MSGFVHLHVHSQYTLLESTVTIPGLVARIAELGMEAVALTDRGGLFGALQFQKAALDAGIAPIIGCQVNLAPLGIAEKSPDMHQLVLLAASPTGYHNLTRLVSAGWLEGFYYEPRIDLSLLERFAEDLYCLTGAGPNGFLNRHLQVGATVEAQRQAGLLRDIFADRLYVELTPHDANGPVDLRAANLELARACGIPPVATNWVHYLRREDHTEHDVLLAIQKATSLSDERRRRMPDDGYYLTDLEEMSAAFADCPEALSNTLVLAEACAGAHIDTGTYYLPVFTCPDDLDTGAYLGGLDAEEYRQRYLVDPNGEERGLDPAALEDKVATDAYLAQLCAEGLKRRYGDAAGPEHRERLGFELTTISRMGFAAYFLIVADFIGWAKDHDIPVGPGRGSAAGSLVAYCLGITDICPLRYGLLFERFLNPGRVSMPDIDIDFCKDGRQQVIDYVADKYGSEAVTQIMTLGTMKARMAIKDVARAYDWTPEEAQALANLIPEDPSGKHTIPVCLGLDTLKGGVKDPSDKLVTRYENDERTRRCLDTAARVENLGRSLGVHACGIIIAPGPVDRYLPVCRVKGKAATQFNMKEVEDCGLLKMDFLGLKTMSILKQAARLAEEHDGVAIDYPSLPLDDPATYRLLGEGDTLGVFQCESSGFRELIRRLQPDRFEDMIALVALYRPGPLENGMHISYCNRKHGLEPVSYPHPVLEQTLQESYGLYIYQEQIMSIARELAGFTPAEADNLRKAVAKKIEALLVDLRPKFVAGAEAHHGFPRGKAEAMFDTFIAFASYCFNKSHSACYGLIAYWTAYMKARHFGAFMTANLIYEMHNKDKMTLFVQELAERGIPVLPPDVNESGWQFTFNGDHVRFGFGGIKGVGETAAEHLMAVRAEDGPFASLYDLCERIDTRKANKRVIENLIKTGAFDSLHPNRNALLLCMDRAFERGQRLARDRQQAQTTLFDTFEQSEDFRRETQGYPEVADWPEHERLAYEKALTGYWISSHPLREYQSLFRPHVTHTSADLIRRPQGELTLAGVVIGKRTIKTRDGKQMAFLQLEDEQGPFEGVLFAGRRNPRGGFEPGPYDRFIDFCEDDTVALIKGTISKRERKRTPPPPSPVTSGDPDDPEDLDAPPPPDEPDVTEERPSVVIEDVIPARLLYERLTKEIVIAVDSERHGEEELRATETLIRENGGDCPLRFQVHTDSGVLVTMLADSHWRLHPTSEALRGLCGIYGSEFIKAVYK